METPPSSRGACGLAGATEREWAIDREKGRAMNISDPTPITPGWGLEEQQTLELWSWAHFPKQGFLCLPKGPGDRGVTCAWGAGGLSRALADSPV